MERAKGARRRVRRGWNGLLMLAAVMFWTQIGAAATRVAAAAGTAPSATPEPVASDFENVNPGGGGGGPVSGALRSPIAGGNPSGIDAVWGPSPTPSVLGGGGGGGGAAGPLIQVFPPRAPVGVSSSTGPDDPQSPGAGPAYGENTSPIGRRSP